MPPAARYREAFFNDAFRQKNPDLVPEMERLERLISSQIEILKMGVQVHRSKCPEALMPMQEKLEDQLGKLDAKATSSAAPAEKRGSVSTSALQRSGTMAPNRSPGAPLADHMRRTQSVTGKASAGAAPTAAAAPAAAAPTAAEPRRAGSPLAQRRATAKPATSPLAADPAPASSGASTPAAQPVPPPRAKQPVTSPRPSSNPFAPAASPSPAAPPRPSAASKPKVCSALAHISAICNV